MDIDKRKLGNKIKNIRRSKGLTLEQFGNIFDASKGVISNWESGRNIPNNDRLKKIAELGDTSVSELLHETTPEFIKATVDEIQDDEIKNYGNQKYKLLYDPKQKKDITETILKNYRFDNLSDIGVKRYVKQILDDLLSESEELRNYTPYSNEHAIEYSHDLLWEAIKKIDSYFKDDSISQEAIDGFLKNGQIKDELSPETYSQIRIAFENLSDYLKTIEIPIIQENHSNFHDLAAHSPDPNKKYSAEKIDEINQRLKEAKNKYK